MAFIAGLVLLTAVACSPQIKFADDEGRFSVSLDARWEDTTDLAIDDWLVNGDIRFELAFAASRFQVRENDPNLSPNVLARLNVLQGVPRQPGQSDNDQQWLTSWALGWIGSQPAGSQSTEPAAYLHRKAVTVEVETLSSDTHEVRRFYRLDAEIGLQSVCSMPADIWDRVTCAEALNGVEVRA